MAVRKQRGRQTVPPPPSKECTRCGTKPLSQGNYPGHSMKARHCFSVSWAKMQKLSLAVELLDSLSSQSGDSGYFLQVASSWLRDGVSSCGFPHWSCERTQEHALAAVLFVLCGITISENHAEKSFTLSLTMGGFWKEPYIHSPRPRGRGDSHTLEFT